MAIKQEATGFLKDFQAFITKGNVIDLAVAVIIGGAFNAIVASLTKDLINPILGVLVGKPDFSDLFWVMKLPEGYAGPMTYDALTKAGASVFGYGAFLTAVIQFLLLAFVIFCFLRALTKAKASLERKEEEAKKAAAAAAAAAPAPTPEDIVLLRAILDELKKKQA